jgi:hypothetical protein
VVLLEGLTDSEQIAARALAIADSIAKPVRVDAVVGEIGVNIGGAIFPLHAASVEELLERADQAMYQANSYSRSTVYTAVGRASGSSDQVPQRVARLVSPNLHATMDSKRQQRRWDRWTEQNLVRTASAPSVPRPKAPAGSSTRLRYRTPGAP